MSLRRKTYMLVGATLLVAAVAIFAVSQWVFVRDGQWTSSVITFTLALLAVVVALGLAVCAILEKSLFKRLANLTEQIRSAGKSGRELSPIKAGRKTN